MSNLEIIRRIAERGLRKAQHGAARTLTGRSAAHAEYIDLFQHLLDELDKVKEDA
jgi:hypothetical protein